MTPTEELIYIQLSAHRAVAHEEHRSEGAWRTVCACYEPCADHDEHLAQMIAQALLGPERAVTFPGPIVPVHRDQVPLFEVPDMGYKGIRL